VLIGAIRGYTFSSIFGLQNFFCMKKFFAVPFYFQFIFFFRAKSIGEDVG
jgi:hypothetical protein